MALMPGGQYVSIEGVKLVVKALYCNMVSYSGLTKSVGLQGVEPVLRTYNTLIIACNMCNQPREAMAVHRRMLNEGYTPNATTYNALISAYGKAGQLDKVMEVRPQHFLVVTMLPLPHWAYSCVCCVALMCFAPCSDVFNVRCTNCWLCLVVQSALHTQPF